MARSIPCYSVFDDEQVDAMGGVFDQVCMAARETRGRLHIPDRELRSRVARAVIETVMTNDCDVPTLTRLALEKFAAGIAPAAGR